MQLLKQVVLPMQQFNLNLSQSAISRQIQALEQDLKVQLFERHARGLTLTENGEYVFKTAHEVISKLKKLKHL
jgi:DNA-binding transcriptional LysR family regulator